jgi:hypothetical protein
MDKQKYCDGCSQLPKKICGKIIIERGTSGSIRYVKVADSRCNTKSK